MLLIILQKNFLRLYIRVEASETPTRSYIVNIAEQERNSILNKKADEKIISEVMDAVLDDIVKQ